MAKCPFCKEEVNFDNLKSETKGLGFLKQEIMYSCPACSSILGIRRGKWSG